MMGIHLRPWSRLGLKFTVLAFSPGYVAAQELPKEAAASVALVSLPSTPQIETNGTIAGVITNRPPDAPRLGASEPNSSPVAKHYWIEFGTMGRKISNYFEAENDFHALYAAPRVSPYVVTLSGRIAYNLLDDDNRTLTAGLRMRHNFYTDLAGADSDELDASLYYKSRPDEFRLELYRKPSRLVGTINRRNVYAATNRVNVEYVHRLTERVRAGAQYEYSRENYTERPEHDLTRQVVNASVQYKFAPWFEPGIGVEYEHGDGRSDNFTYEQVSPVLILNSSIWPVAYMGVSYKWYDRKYLKAGAGESNYQRIDRRQNVSFYGTLRVGGGLSVFSFVYYTKSNSNQSSSSFSSCDAGVGLFYRFN